MRIRKCKLARSFAQACGSEFATNTKLLQFMQKLCTRLEWIQELDKLYVNVHDAILMDGKKRQFKTQEAFSRDAAQRPFPKEVAKELG
ncbi:hypothetical protein BCR44DRAFT_1426272 [Catenaria anguillulae PL171]|uniref:Uncharacterized protein n=1 Tax=Catenaria anguillulae PL171 TaxID=765915 RepID=A0A1Y2HZT8_9FUNG|nr:hypothetical protein BCR44DRAFT_1426272 [Catenaria anguillulae PL171]